MKRKNKIRVRNIYEIIFFYRRRIKTLTLLGSYKINLILPYVKQDFYSLKTNYNLIFIWPQIMLQAKIIRKFFTVSSQLSFHSFSLSI